jgi:hypothetical protein
MGEDANDAEALAELISALCPAVTVTPLRKPLVLRRQQATGTVSVMQKKVVPLLRAELAKGAVLCVFVHADADTTAPNDEEIARQIDEQLEDAPVRVHAVVPASALEAWWFLWPDAPLAVIAAWRPLTAYQGRDVGRIHDAKTELRRALRPQVKKKPRDYRESDAPAIARAVRQSGRISEPAAKSGAYERFRRDVASCCP